MPDTELNLSVDAILTAAQNKLRNFYAEWEAKSLKLNVDVGGGTGTNVPRATFSGMAVPTGPMPSAVLPPRSSLAPAQPVQLMDLSSAMTSRFIGGSGFGTAVRPLPTAALNTVYGSVGSQQQVGPFGTYAALPGSAMAARLISPPPPVAPPATAATPLQTPASATPSAMTAGQQAVNAWRNFVNGQVSNAYTPAAGPGPLPVARVGSLMTMNPAGPSLASRFLKGANPNSLAMGAFGLVFTGAAAADQYATEYQTSIDAQRFDSVTEVAVAEASAARSTNYLRRRSASFLNRIRINQFLPKGFEFTTDETVAETDDTARRSRANDERTVNLRQNRGFALSTASLGFRGVSAEIAKARIDTITEVAELDAQIKLRGNAGADDLEQRKALVQSRGRALESRARSDYFNSLEDRGRAAGGMASRGAFRNFEASMRDINEGFTQERSDLQRSGSLLSSEEYRSSLSDIQYRQGLAQNILRNTAMAQSVNNAMLNEAQATASRLRIGGNPLAADRAIIRANTDSRIAAINLDPSSPGYARERNSIVAQGESEVQLASYNFNVQTVGIGIGLSTQRLALGAALKRNFVGSQAISTAGGAIGEAFGLFTSGRKGLARQRLANGIGELQVQAQNYGDSFDAVEMDAFNTSFANPRDFDNPQAVFDAFNQQAGKLERLSKADDRSFITAASSESGANVLPDMKSAVDRIEQILRELAGSA